MDNQSRLACKPYKRWSGFSALKVFGECERRAVGLFSASFLCCAGEICASNAFFSYCLNGSYRSKKLGCEKLCWREIDTEVWFVVFHVKVTEGTAVMIYEDGHDQNNPSKFFTIETDWYLQYFGSSKNASLISTTSTRFRKFRKVHALLWAGFSSCPNQSKISSSSHNYTRLRDQNTCPIRGPLFYTRITWAKQADRCWGKSPKDTTIGRGGGQFLPAGHRRVAWFLAMRWKRTLRQSQRQVAGTSVRQQ